MRSLIWTICTCVAIAAFAVPAMATVNTNDEWGVKVTGAGAKKFNREINIAFLLSNTAVNNTVAPDRLKKFTISSPSVRWNRRGYKVKTCNSARTTDGSSIKCSKRTKIGTGKFRAVLGHPGQSLFIFGALSEFTGKVTLYNYKRQSGTVATIMAEMRVSSPAGAAGTYFTIPAPIDRRGNVDVEIPDLPQLPPQIGSQVQLGAHAILTHLSVKIKSPRPRSRRQKPFASLNNRKPLGAAVNVIREDG